MARCKIIAEVGSNHGGNIDLAKQYIAEASRCGADIVKFQSWQYKELSPKWTTDREYYERCELSDEAHYILYNTCKEYNIEFLTTVFSVSRVPFLFGLSPKHIKIASTDVTSTRLLTECREHFDHVFLSTGMSTEDEIQWASYLLSKDSKPFTLFHCVSEYPTAYENTRMARMVWLKQFSDSVGLSCHSEGILSAMTAIARGAEYIEKHFILEHNNIYKDNKVSITPDELTELCQFRDAVELMDMDETNDPSDEELEVRARYVGRWGDNK